MKWVWQKKEYPKYIFDPTKYSNLESQFLVNAGNIRGTLSTLDKTSNENSFVQIILEEALSSAKIEGEVLRRDSVQSSLRKQLGLKSEKVPTSPEEYGMAEMLTHVHINHKRDLSHDDLFLWHKMLFNGRRDLENIGSYRSHEDPMQVVSGNPHNPKVFYEAPPSKSVHLLMEGFIQWFNKETKSSSTPLIVIASIAHLYFEQIHPFEDGNGRIGRAICEKAISKRLGFPSLTGISLVIEKKKSPYYEALQKSNYSLDISAWLDYHCQLLLKSQSFSKAIANHTLQKTRMLSEFGSVLNDRQLKVLKRIYDAGIHGFKGGLSAKNYQSITRAPSATATRDLADLVKKQILLKDGVLKGTRYYLNKETN